MWIESQSPVDTPRGYMYTLYENSACKYQKKWENLMKNNISLQWLKWGTPDTSKLFFLCPQLETTLKLN